MVWWRLLTRLPIFIAGFMLLISACLLAYMVIVWRSTVDFILYPLEYHSLAFRTQLAYVTIPALLIVCFLSVFHPRVNRVVVRWAGAILLVANLLAFGSAFIGSAVVHHHLDDVTYHSSRYVMTFSYGTQHPGYPWVRLHECDAWLILCRDRYAYGGWRVASQETPDYPWQGWLILNEAAGTLEVEVNSKIVYTHLLR